MKKDEFYIGYLPKAPKKIARTTLLAVVGFFILLGVTAFIIVSGQQTINNGTYEFGELTEVEGLIYKTPHPFIKVSAGKDIEGNEVYKNILLINFGKFGASETLEKIESKVGVLFNSVYVKLRGTLIYHNGVTLLELTELENSYISYRPMVDRYQYSKKTTDLGQMTLSGEIVDSKCYFGSMKPGEGKPHRSCAALCISGGIPPVYVVQNENKEADYYLMVGANGQQINQELLPYVAENVTLKGRVEQSDEWKILYVNPDDIQRGE